MWIRQKQILAGSITCLVFCCSVIIHAANRLTWCMCLSVSVILHCMHISAAAESSRSTESTNVESIDFQLSGVDLFDSIDFKVYCASCIVKPLQMMSVSFFVVCISSIVIMSPTSPIDNIWATVIVWRIRGSIIRTVWPGGIVVRALDLRLQRSRVKILTVPLSDLGKLPVSPSSMNLAPVNGRWCPAAGKVTVGLASHWPCVTDQWFIRLRTHSIRKGDEHPAYTPHGVWHSFIVRTAACCFVCDSCNWFSLCFVC